MFQPVIPVEGLAGWRFLQKTYDKQLATFTASAQQKRDGDYFIEKIAKVTSAEELVKDRRLLSVALGAFGLQDDIDNRYFIRKVLEEGTASDDTLANRLSDPRYRELSDAFGFGPAATLRIGREGFAAEIVARFQANGFEVATGAQNDSMRIALYAQRVLPALAEREGSTDTKWFTIMGDPPLRELFEKALNLPKSVGQIDIDQQLEIFKERAEKAFGSDDVGRFALTENVQDAITKFLVRDQLSDLSTGLSGTSIALTLLRG